MIQKKPSLCEDENEGGKNRRQNELVAGHFTVSKGLTQGVYWRQKGQAGYADRMGVGHRHEDSRTTP